MSWVPFRQRKPAEGDVVITRCRLLSGATCIERWEYWLRDYYTWKPPFTHWWTGEEDLDKAKRAWYEDKEDKEL